MIVSEIANLNTTSSTSVEMWMGVNGRTNPIIKIIKKKECN